MTSLDRQKTFFDLFPAPEFLLLSATGIAISDTDIKFVQLRKEIFGGGFSLAHSSKVDISQGAVESGLIKNSEELKLALKKLSKDFGIRYAQATLPEEKTYLFIASLERVPMEGLRDAVAFIIEGNVPVTLPESVFDFEVINKNDNTGKIKVAVSVVPEIIVKSYTELLESAGITPISFDLESQAIARAVIKRGNMGTTLLVNLSISKTGFYLVEDEVVQFSTTLSYGVGEDGSHVIINDLKAEMHKVFAFWSARSGQMIQRIILCGKGSNNSSFVENFMNETEVEFALAEVPFGQSIEYAPAIGLVLPKAR